jgi:hypothetical protein
MSTIRTNNIMPIKIYDNFLPKEEFENIKSIFTHWNFPWYYVESVLAYDEDIKQIENEKLNFQFAHSIYDEMVAQSDVFYKLKPLFEAIDPFHLIKVKANLNPNSGNIQYEHGMHKDIKAQKNLNLKTAVYYLNTNNGYTKIDSTNEKIESVENRLVVFNSNELHTGSTTTDQKNRILININFIPKSILDV